LKPRSEAKSLTPFDSLIYAQPLRGEAIIISYALLLFTAVLALANLATVGRAHRAILRGDWFAHRNMMLASLALWGLTLLAAAGGFFGLFPFAPGIMRGIIMALSALWLALALITSAALALTLYRVARHELLPHKLLARKTIRLWRAACLANTIIPLCLLAAPFFPGG